MIDRKTWKTVDEFKKSLLKRLNDKEVQAVIKNMLLKYFQEVVK